MKPDGLTPLGEQLELPWTDGGPQPLTVREVIIHRAEHGPAGWYCTCGAGRTWVPHAPKGRARAAVLIHMRAVAARMATQPPDP